MDFENPAGLAAYLGELDEFIEREICPLEQQDDNIRFFDHRREDARTGWDRGGLPDRQWEALLREAVRRADAAPGGRGRRHAGGAAGRLPGRSRSRPRTGAPPPPSCSMPSADS